MAYKTVATTVLLLSLGISSFASTIVPGCLETVERRMRDVEYLKRAPPAIKEQGILFPLLPPEGVSAEDFANCIKGEIELKDKKYSIFPYKGNQFIYVIREIK